MSDERRYEIKTTYSSDGSSRSTVREYDPMAAARGAADAILRLEATQRRIRAEEAAKTEAEKAKMFEWGKKTLEIYPKPDYDSKKENFPNFLSLIRRTYEKPEKFFCSIERMDRNIFLFWSVVIALGLMIGALLWRIILVSSSISRGISTASCIAIPIIEFFVIKIRQNDFRKKHLDPKLKEQEAQKKEILLACFEAERTNELYMQAYGTEWTRNNPMPEDSSTWYEWEMRRRQEDKDYFDCVTNTEWARQNPETCEYSYTESLGNYGRYGDIYGHLLWLTRRNSEDQEFKAMKNKLKASPFFQYIERDSWINSLSFIREYNTWLNAEKEAKELAERQAEAEKEARYKEYQALSKK